MSNFEEWNDLVDILYTLFRDYPVKDRIPMDCEWAVSKAGKELVRWLLDDLHVSVDHENGKIYIHHPTQVGRKYIERKVHLLYMTLQEICNAD